MSLITNKQILSLLPRNGAVASWALVALFGAISLWGLAEFSALITALEDQVSSPPQAGELARGVLILLVIYWLQSLFYVVPVSEESAVFMREQMFGVRLVFLPLASSSKLEIGPLWELFQLDSTSDGESEEEAFVNELERRLATWNILKKLSFLVESRSPLDFLLDKSLASWPKTLALPLRLVYLLMSPARQVMKMWGYVFLKAWQYYYDPGPLPPAFLRRILVAWELKERAENIYGEHAESEVCQCSSVEYGQILKALRTVYGDPSYGGSTSELADSLALPFGQIPFLASRYRGIYFNQAATLGVSTLAEIYDDGPAEDPKLFYPSELSAEAESLALLLAHKARLSSFLAQSHTEGLLWLDGRPAPPWVLAQNIYELDLEIAKERYRLASHNRRCRSSHLALSSKIGLGWPERLKGLAAHLLFAEQGVHALTLVLEDAEESFEKSLRQDSEWFDAPKDYLKLPPLQELYQVMEQIYDALLEIGQPQGLSWRAELPESWPLSAPMRDDSLNWLDEKALPVAMILLESLNSLKEISLVALLEAEECVATMSKMPTQTQEAPPAPAVIAPFPLRHRKLLAPPRVYSWAAAFKAGWERNFLALLVLYALFEEAQLLI